MKVYRANEELANILFDHGFIDTTSEKNKIKGKRSFKLSKNARKEIYFDYINIRIEDSIHNMDNCIEMNENDLKILLLYFKLTSADRKELTTKGTFKFKKIMDNLSSITKELEDLKRLDLHHTRQIKIERIIDSYKSINI